MRRREEERRVRPEFLFFLSFFLPWQSSGNGGNGGNGSGKCIFKWENKKKKREEEFECANNSSSSSSNNVLFFFFSYICVDRLLL